MRLILRLLGTWLLGIAVILVVIDGTRSLAASGLTITPLGETWRSIHEASLLGLYAFFETRFFGAILEPALDGVLALPGWVVFGVPGALLAWMGRTRRAKVFVRQDQF